jgi:exodeoxyribonuclease VII large subunit
VTSLDGAAIRDIVKVLGRLHRNAHLVIRPARVQGEGAAAEIARALRAIVRVPGVDVVIVGRGGGSIEDLWAFNEEVVARAIGAAPVPVISAVGHETDVTIADFVADVRAPTPSAAAEMVVAAKDEFCSRIDRLEGRLRGSVRSLVQRHSRRLHVVSSRPALAAWPGRLALRGRHLGELTHALAGSVRGSLGTRLRALAPLARRLEACDPGRRLGAVRARLVAVDGRLGNAIARQRHRSDARLREAAGRLDTLSPLAVLGRGYAICWTADGTDVVRDVANITVGDRVRVGLARGELDCEVRGKAPGRNDDGIH